MSNREYPTPTNVHFLPTAPVQIEVVLFVSGTSVLTQRAIRDAGEVCARYLGAGALFRIVDVANDPELAEKYNLLATPVLLRLEPKPERRITGNLSDHELVAETLQLR